MIRLHRNLEGPFQCRCFRRSATTHRVGTGGNVEGVVASSYSSHARDITASPTVPTLCGDRGHDGNEPEEPGGGKRQRQPEHGAAAASSATYKTTRKRTAEIKVRKRAPWGMQQLRDSWSVDAMTKGDRENMSERIHREYRYHPEEFRRNHIKVAALLTIPALLIGAFSGYFYQTGRPLWEADPQYLLNMIRQMDASPRSTLHPYKLEETEVLPAHVKAYREKNWEKRLLLEGYPLATER
ncbi:uncharacterized protein TEOVI_000591800 [Trypanosoma equiperdum]|uniref:Uncharacterized protein n=2 Tax=Trypanozoon TaxID=39700 RepID=Q57XB9_TRYB2|nr:hypothetical protein, conserved [Trypanosoma brucei brucei TREU927]AAX69750.1 hypothetical protein, conserved [Trypanosoma brucei]AAZ13037.1 hypothetical protein, conserved [Trypanosoma brucei brucei TREU927]SCU66192.1 hypothetical protein, conserved [Trypanosoma equiperdum]